MKPVPEHWLPITKKVYRRHVDDAVRLVKHECSFLDKVATWSKTWEPEKTYSPSSAALATNIPYSYAETVLHELVRGHELLYIYDYRGRNFGYHLFFKDPKTSGVFRPDAPDISSIVQECKPFTQKRKTDNRKFAKALPPLETLQRMTVVLERTALHYWNRLKEDLSQLQFRPWIKIPLLQERTDAVCEIHEKGFYAGGTFFSWRGEKVEEPSWKELVKVGFNSVPFYDFIHKSISLPRVTRGKDTYFFNPELLRKSIESDSYRHQRRLGWI